MKFQHKLYILGTFLITILYFANLQFKTNYLRGHNKQHHQKHQQQQQSIQLNIIEDHQDALNYWLQAIDANIIQPNKGIVTIIHIDAHNDMAFPIAKSVRLLSNIRIDKQKPKNHNKTFSSYTMPTLENDEFIYAAAMLGIQLRVIYVQPRWNMVHQRISNKLITPHITKVTIGTAVSPIEVGKKLKKGTATKSSTDAMDDLNCICFLLTHIDGMVDSSSLGNKTNCQSIEEEEQNIQLQICTHFIQSMEVIVVNDLDVLATSFDTNNKDKTNAFLNILNGYKDVGGGIILDIDLDYFGSVEKIQPMVPYMDKVTRVISNALGICDNQIELTLKTIFNKPETLEIIALDQMIRTVVQNLLVVHVADGGRDIVDSQEDLDNTVSIVSSYFQQHFQCTLTEKNVIDFVAVLNDGSKAELIALDRYGICFRENEVTPCFEQGEVDQEDTNDAWTRDGRTDPSLDVQERHQQKETVAKRIRDFSRVLNSFVNVFQMKPNVITLCRSVRDGYVYLEQWKDMEENVMHVLDQLFEKKKDQEKIEIVKKYDSRLWGGKGGWVNRNRMTRANKKVGT